MFDTWLKTVLFTDLGVTGELTESGGIVFPETIHYEGVKGADDAETLRNLGAGLVTNRDYKSVGGDTLHIYREGTGQDCAGATALFLIAARILGYTAYQSGVGSTGHVFAIVEIGEDL